MEEYQASVRQFNNVHSRMQMMKKELYKFDLLLDELQTKPNDIYLALGKAFVLSNYEELKQEIQIKHDNLEKDIKKVEPLEQNLAQKVNEAQEKLIKQAKQQQN